MIKIVERVYDVLKLIIELDLLCLCPLNNCSIILSLLVHALFVQGERTTKISNTTNPYLSNSEFTKAVFTRTRRVLTPTTVEIEVVLVLLG